jgi:hypothetical protein
LECETVIDLAGDEKKLSLAGCQPIEIFGVDLILPEIAIASRALSSPLDNAS